MRIYWVAEAEVDLDFTKESISVCDVLMQISDPESTLSLPWGLHLGGSYISQTKI